MNSIRTILIAVALLGLGMVVLWEVILAFPVPWWFYTAVTCAFAVGLLRFAPVWRQRVGLTVFATVVGVMGILYLVDWTTRKPFLRDLARVQVGMTEKEVREIMGRYLEGTGWPATPGTNSADGPGTLTDVATGSQHTIRASRSGELTLHDALVFRHSNDGVFNSDWGIVSLSAGRVANVEFSPD